MIKCWTQFWGTGCIEGGGYDTFSIAIVLMVIIVVLLLFHKRILSTKNSED